MADKFKTTYNSGSFVNNTVLTAPAINLEHSGIDIDIEAIAAVLGDVYGDSIQNGGIAYVSKMIRALGPVGILTPPIIDHPDLADYYNGTKGSEIHIVAPGKPVFELFVDFQISSVTSITVDNVPQTAMSSLDTLVPDSYFINPLNEKQITFYNDISGTTVKIIYEPLISGDVPKSSGFNTIPSLPDFINNNVSCALTDLGGSPRVYQIDLPVLSSGYEIQLVDLFSASHVTGVNNFIHTTAQIQYAWPKFITDNPVANYQTGGYDGVIPSGSVLLYRKNAGQIERIQFNDEPSFSFNVASNTITFSTNDVISDTQVLVVPTQGSSIAQLLNYYMNFAQAHDHGDSGGKSIDHAFLTGLTDPLYGYSSGIVTKKNVHPQYLHRAGFDKNDVSIDGNNDGNAFIGELRLGPAEEFNYSDGGKTSNMPPSFGFREGALTSVSGSGKVNLVILGSTGEIISDANNYFESNSLVQTEGIVQFRTIPGINSHSVVNINNANTGILDIVSAISTTESGQDRFKTALNIRSPNSGLGEGVALTLGNDDNNEAIKIYGCSVDTSGNHNYVINTLGNEIASKIVFSSVVRKNYTAVRGLGFMVTDSSADGTVDAGTDGSEADLYYGIIPNAYSSTLGASSGLAIATNLKLNEFSVGNPGTSGTPMSTSIGSSAIVSYGTVSGTKRIGGAAIYGRLNGSGVEYWHQILNARIEGSSVSDRRFYCHVGGNGEYVDDNQIQSIIRIGTTKDGSLTTIYTPTTSIKGNVIIGPNAIGETTTITGNVGIPYASPNAANASAGLISEIASSAATMTVAAFNDDANKLIHSITLNLYVENAGELVTFSTNPPDNTNIYTVYKNSWCRYMLTTFRAFDYTPLVAAFYASPEDEGIRGYLKFVQVLVNQTAYWAIDYHRDNNSSTFNDQVIIRMLRNK